MATNVQQQVKAKINECLQRGNKLYKAKATIDSIVVTNSIKNKYGLAGWNPKEGWVIRISRDTAERFPDFIMDEIVPHEVAHIICMWLHLNKKPFGDDGHGDNWAKVAQALGSTGEVGQHPPENQFHYKTSGDTMVKLSPEQHHQVQNQYKVLRTADGHRITAAGYQPK